MTADVKLNQIGTHLKVRDFDRSMAFYSALGFPLLREFGPGTEAPEAYRGAVFDIGCAYIEIAEGHTPIKPQVFLERITSSKVSLLVNVSSLVPLVERCREYGVDILVSPRRFHWGQIELVIQDPDGFILSFSAPDIAEEAKALQSLFDVAIDRNKPDYTEAHLVSLRERRRDTL